MKRFFDIMFSLFVLIASSPLLLIAAIGIKITSPGPMFYRAKRVGLNALNFDMFKFRTMHLNNGGSVITAQDDPRIFGFGKFLRKSKIDELPQFLNVLLGQMSIVGPRPEDPKIVKEAYEDWMMKTLLVRPGITSPGAVYYYVSAEKSVDNKDPEKFYVENLLPVKLAIEHSYIQRATFLGDVKVVFHTALVVICALIGLKAPMPEKVLKVAKAQFPELVF